ncbi:hypothetical protein [Nocardioides dongxiaopingii]|uniref:hypothetical protein n=1 Tax=Nocardioides dongxiaopingii TaxID=2576036 RepID=UPI0010C7695E|nr:hypothetical protein [Nocardioides dongxiaopingii]
MTRTRLGLAAAGVLALVTLVTPASHAETGSVGEAPEVGVPAHLDLAELTVANRQRRLEVDLILDAVAPRRTSAYAIVAPVAGRRGPTFVVGWSQLRGEPDVDRGPIFVRIDGEGLTPVRCQGARVRPVPAQTAIRISVPQRCLGATAGTVRVDALTERSGGGDVDELGPVRVRRG